MCANYHPVTAQDRLVQYFGVDRPIDAVPPDLYPGGLAPFILRERDRAELARDLRLGLFGLLPHWAKDLAFGRRTYNARSETVAEKPSFRDAWRQGNSTNRLHEGEEPLLAHGGPGNHLRHHFNAHI